MTTVPHDTAHTRLLAALQHHGCRRERPGSWTCPAHEDRNASLSVTPRDDRVLVRCHAGCTIDAITSALGMSKADLFDRDPTRDTPTRRNGHSIIATYPYTDEAGQLLFEVCRLAPKDFRQRAPDGHGGWTWTTRDIRRVPYRLPKVIQTARQGGTIHIVEGEKDVHAIEQAGGTATTSPGGAGKWRTDYNPHFRGAHIVVVADNDRPGLDHAETIRSNLTGIAASIQVVRAASGKDAADHLAEGHTLNDFINLDDTAPRITFETGLQIIDRAPENTPWVWEGYVAQGEITLFAGAAKAGKTTLLFSLIQAITGRNGSHLNHTITPGPVVLLTEEGPGTLRPKLERIPRDALENLHILHRNNATPRTFTWAEAVHDAGQHATKIGAPLVVIDTLAFWTQIRDENDSALMQEAVTSITPLTAQGLAVILVHHHRKGGGSDGTAIRGSSALLGAVDIIVEMTRPGDEDTDTRTREIHAVGRHDETPEALHVLMGADHTYTVVCEGSKSYVKSVAVQTRVANLMQTSPHETFTQPQLVTETGASKGAVSAALASLVNDQTISAFTSQRPHRYRWGTPQ